MRKGATVSLFRDFVTDPFSAAIKLRLILFSNNAKKQEITVMTYAKTVNLLLWRYVTDANIVKANG